MLRLQKIVKTHKHRLLTLENVVGVGIGNKIVGGKDTGEKALVVLVSKKKPLSELKAENVVPARVEDVSTDVIEIGTPRLLAPAADRKGYHRPANPGTSLGHYMTTAGTFGAVVFDNKTNEPYMLSNNHVLANTNDGRNGRSKIGDPVLQPGPYDGGTVEKNTIAKLARFVPVYYENEKSVSMGSDGLYRGRVNRVDCALARPVSPDAISPEVLGLGRVDGTAPADVGTQVIKSGRTSGVTYGNIRAVDSAVKVSFGDDEYGLFEGQLVSDMKSEPGDSGSIVVNREHKAVGLLFAGSETAAVINPIKDVCDALDVYIPAAKPAARPTGPHADFVRVALLLLLFVLFARR